jgi:translation initiation factor 2-alpha kinase 4
MKRYPFISPNIQLENVRGLSNDEQRLLMNDLKRKCHSLAKSGLVMVCELVQLVEDFLLVHNKDPSNAGISAWDQMQAREEEKKKIAEKAERSLDFMYDDVSPSRTKDQYDDSLHHSNHMDDVDEERIKKEYARQTEALKAAEERRKLRAEYDNAPDSDENDVSSDEEEDDFEFDGSYVPSSRYQCDFIELGHLGRGGGGEVVKVRNRLDRRVYAVKKVILQPESGKFEIAGKLENAKLKREVTTISRMTHKNIVRYYQGRFLLMCKNIIRIVTSCSLLLAYCGCVAWVEGGEMLEDPENGIRSTSEKSESQNGDKSIDVDESESSVSGRKGFWTSFNDDDSDDSSSSSSSWSNDSEEKSAIPQICEEVDFINSPLMVGFGGINKLESNLMKQYQNPSTSNNESFSDLDTSLTKKKYDGSRRILYIQMEYCTSSLRHCIDKGALQKMEKDDVWKMVRQILEALQYIHKVRSMILVSRMNFEP